MKKTIFLIVFSSLLIFKLQAQELDVRVNLELSLVDSIFKLKSFDTLLDEISPEQIAKSDIGQFISHDGLFVKDSIATVIQRKADSLYSEGNYELAASMYKLHINITNLLIYSVYLGIEPLRIDKFPQSLTRFNKLLDATRMTFDRYFINAATSYHNRGKCFELIDREKDALVSYTSGLNTLSIFYSRDREVYIYNQLRSSLYKLIGTDWFNEFNQN